jgi:palmitoyltransferase
MWVTNLLLFISLCICMGGLSLIYGNDKGNRMVDKISQLIRNDMFRGIGLLLSRILGKSTAIKVVTHFNNLLEYIFLKPNPLIVYLYIFLCCGGYIVFVVYGYPDIPNPVIPLPYHQHMGFVLFFITMLFFTKACSDDPGIIHGANHKNHLTLFSADGLIFPKNSIACATCKFQKPPRSKHCSMCNVCVGRFDHHCVWINQCVGIGNLKSFLFFLLFNNLLCLYGSYLGCGIIQNIVQERDLLGAVFRDRITGQTYKASVYYIFMYLVGHHKQIVFLTLFCTCIGIFLTWFTWYHWVTLMRAGITTNEDVKFDKLARRNKRDNMYNKGSWWKNLRTVLSYSKLEYTATTYRKIR